MPPQILSHSWSSAQACASIWEKNKLKEKCVIFVAPNPIGICILFYFFISLSIDLTSSMSLTEPNNGHGKSETVIGAEITHFTIKEPLLWVMKDFIFWIWDSTTTGWHACKVKKTHSFSYNMHFIFTLIAQRLPNDSLNDSFFQTPPLHHANQRWWVQLADLI